MQISLVEEGIDKFLAKPYHSIKGVMRIIDRGGFGIAFIVNDHSELLGLVTDGDIRRGIINGIDIDNPVNSLINTSPITVHDNWTQALVKQMLNSDHIRAKFPEHRAIFIPVLNFSNKITQIMCVSEELESRRIQSGAEWAGRIHSVLVIGGAGYLGSVLCDRLLREGYKVKVLDNFSCGDEGLKALYSHEYFTLIEGDMRDISAVVKTLEGVDAVIHLAGIVGDAACAADPRQTLEINYLATKVIIEACKYAQINRLIFASTCSVYGQSLDPESKLTEKSPSSPVSLYAQSKAKCEESIMSAVDENFSPTILRMGTLFGYSPNMRFDLFVNTQTAKALVGDVITIYGGDQWRPFLHLEDAVEAYLLCLKAPLEVVAGEIFNVVSTNQQIIDVGHIVKRLYPEAELSVNTEAADIRDYHVSCDKIFFMLGYTPRKTIEDGVLEIANKLDQGVITDYKDPRYSRAM
jgi:nucleoside-diphosphate-sugar epimerase